MSQMKNDVSLSNNSKCWHLRLFDQTPFVTQSPNGTSPPTYVL